MGLGAALHVLRTCDPTHNLYQVRQPSGPGLSNGLGGRCHLGGGVALGRAAAEQPSGSVNKHMPCSGLRLVHLACSFSNLHRRFNSHEESRVNLTSRVPTCLSPCLSFSCAGPNQSLALMYARQVFSYLNCFLRPRLTMYPSWP